MGSNCYVRLVTGSKDSVEYVAAVCLCGWRGSVRVADAEGEQSALNDGRAHYGKKPISTMSRTAARPVYSFEIESEARKNG